MLDLGSERLLLRLERGQRDREFLHREPSGAPVLVATTAATAHAGTTDSVVSPDGKYFYVESGGGRKTIDVFTIGSTGTLTQIETIFNIPAASEGLAIS